MDQSFSHKIIKNSLGQSTVEYILLLAVLVGIGVTIFKNPRFKNLLSGKDGFFLTMRKGMAYSYRYGRMPSTDAEYEAGMQFEYSTLKHDTYYNSSAGQTHFFFAPEKKYPK